MSSSYTFCQAFDKSFSTSLDLRCVSLLVSVDVPIVAEESLSMDSNQQGDSPEHVGDGSGDVAVLESKDVGTLQHRKQGYLTSTWSPGVYVMTRSCCIAYVKN